ncbi:MULTISPECIES: hypothetical protein [unclassified Sphingobium]|uniref:hypothetical protein n=1 Tax=unclassified Sphingobium TaxID=2611147 RepID=UPI0035A596EA
MTLAGLSPAGVLNVRAGEAMLLFVALTEADGSTAQDLYGRRFALVVRRSDRLSELVTIDAELSDDGQYMQIPITAAQATLIYNSGSSAALSYDIVELSGGASVSRWTARVSVAPGPDIAGEIVPIWIDLPYSEALISPSALVVTERGGRGRQGDRGEPGPDSTEAGSVAGAISGAAAGATAGANAGAQAAIDAVGDVAAAAGAQAGVDAAFGTGFTFRLTATATESVSTILASDSSRKQLRVRNPSNAATVVLHLNNGTPSIGNRACPVLGPGEGVVFEGSDCPVTAIRAVTLGGAAELEMVVVNSSGYDPRTAGVLARFPTPPTGARLDAIVNLYNGLGASGWLDALQSLFVIAGGDNQASSNIDWVGNGLIVPSGGPLYQANSHYQGVFQVNGQGQQTSGAHLNTGVILPSGKYKTNDATMFAWVIGTDIDFLHFVLSFGGGALQVNRSTSGGGTVALRANSSIAQAVTIGGLGGLFSFKRDNAANVKIFRNDSAPVEISYPSEVVPNRELVGLANNSATGVNSWSLSKLAIFGVGRAMPDAKYAELYNLFRVFLIARGAI